MVSRLTPSSSISMASSMYGVSARLTRKPGALFTGAGSRSIAAEERARLRQHVGRHLVVAHHLDQLHARHRIEEMQADELLGPLQAGAQLLQRNARRVGGEDRVRPHLRLDRGIDLALELERLRHRLDHQVGGAHALAREIGDQPVERVARLDPLVADLAEQLGRARDRLAERLGLHVGERHGEPVPGAPGRDVAAHCAGADDVHALAGEVAVGQALELLAQEEHAHQVARGIGDHEPGERRDLRLLHGCAHRRRGSPKGRSARTARDNARPAPSSRSPLRMRLAASLRPRSVLTIWIRRPPRRVFNLPATAAVAAASHVPLRHHRIDEAERPWRGRRATLRPVSIMVMASSGLISRGKRTVPPRPGCRPSITSGKPSRASSIAIR